MFLELIAESSTRESSFSPPEICLMRKMNRAVTVAARATEVANESSLPSHRRRTSSSRVYFRSRSYGHSTFFSPVEKPFPFGRPCSRRSFSTILPRTVRNPYELILITTAPCSPRISRRGLFDSPPRTCHVRVSAWVYTLTHITFFFRVFTERGQICMGNLMRRSYRVFLSLC